MRRVGIKLQNELGIRDNLSLAQYAEARGLSSVWVSEYRARDALANMAIYAAATERVRIGCSIIPLYTRSPAVMAMATATVAELGRDRTVVGLGTSSEVIVSRWHGRERARPLRAMREYVESVRQILAGGKVRYEGELVNVDGFGLEHEFLAAPDAELYVAALGEKMLALGSKIGDGVLLNMTAIEDLPRIRSAVDSAAAEAGRAPGEVKVAGDLRVGVGAGDALHEMREKQRKQVAYYGNVPPYNRFYHEAGFTAEAAELKDAFAAKDTERAIATVHDGMLDAIVAIGSRETVRDRIAQLWDAGMDEVIMFPLAAGQPTMDATRELIDVAAEALERDGEHAGVS